MKETHTCPKCQSVDIIRIKPFPGTSTTGAVQLSKWGTQFGHVDRFVCTQCGYMEQYANLHEKGWQKWLRKKQESNAPDSDFV